MRTLKLKNSGLVIVLRNISSFKPVTLPNPDQLAATKTREGCEVTMNSGEVITLPIRPETLSKMVEAES